MPLDAIPVRTVVRGACPHDCPDTCAMLVTVESGRAIEVRGAPRSSADRRHALHEGRPLSGTDLLGRARALPDASRGQEGRRPIRAHLLGRGARRDRGEVRRDRRFGRWPAGHPAVLVRGDDGPPAIRLDGSPVFPSPRRVAPRPDDLCDRGQGGMGRDDRRRHGDRRRAIREQPPGPDLGQQPDRVQSAPVGARTGGQAPRCEAHRHRSVPQPDGGEVPRAHRAPSRYRCRAGTRHDARA